MSILGADDLDAETVEATLGCILKYQRDLQAIQAQDGNEVVLNLKRAATQVAAGTSFRGAAPS